MQRQYCLLSCLCFLIFCGGVILLLYIPTPIDGVHRLEYIEYTVISTVYICPFFQPNTTTIYIQLIHPSQCLDLRLHAWNIFVTYVIVPVILIIATSLVMTYHFWVLARQKPFQVHPEPVITTESPSQSYVSV